MREERSNSGKYYSEDEDICKLRNKFNRDTFHLQSEHLSHSDDKSLAESSANYKHKIDLLFDETRSSVTGSSVNMSKYDGSSSAYTVQCSRENYHDQHNHEASLSVQNEIETMFENMESKEILDYSAQKFPVEYLGSISLTKKVSSLMELQEPLKLLFLNYIRNGNSTNLLHGSLEITKCGLKVKYHGDKVFGFLEQVNPFSSIAIWAAVKFVCRKKQNINSRVEHIEFAFIPLISDNVKADNDNMFRKLTQRESSLIMKGKFKERLPLFIVVMRQIGLSRQLECHGFICSSNNDAIVIAANLYTTLIQSMKNSDNIRCGSWRYNPDGDNKSISVDDESRNKSSERSKILIKSRSHIYSQSKNSEKSGNQITDNTEMSIHSNDVDVNNNNRSKRSSYIKSSLSSINTISDSGDILTRVAIPRSISSLNAGKPFYLSNSRNQSKIDCLPEAYKKQNLESPLGLKELFQEFKNQEGLCSLNDILNCIIKSDGMSYNELKPIYKEFLLRLALTLTKDELYQKSKLIMQKQKKQKLHNYNCYKSRQKYIHRKNSFRTKINLKKHSSSKNYLTKYCRVDNSKSKFSMFKDLKRTCESEIAKYKLLDKYSNYNGKIKKTSLLNQSSSGYCSECSYNSDSCSCSSVKRCYCSLGSRSRIKNYKKYCEFNSDSCVESEKCYCDEYSTKAVRQIKLKQFNPNFKYSSTNSFQLHNNKTSRNSSKSIQKIDVRPPNTNSDNCAENLVVDYDLFTVKNSNSNNKNKKLLVVSDNVHKNKKKCELNKEKSKWENSEALAAKKSAEIAALFNSDKQDSGKEDALYNVLESNYSQQYNLKNSLGYLP